MVSQHSLKTSLTLLTDITNQTHSAELGKVANAIWQKQLNPSNPLWQHVATQIFSVQNKTGSAHVMALVDARMPKLGLVGFFGATTVESGVEVLRQACDWLKQRGLTDAYGPINGTITGDYRFNLSEDYRISGEPVNPSWYIDVFRLAGFAVFNRYISGIARHPYLYIRFVTSKKPVAGYEHISLRPFDPKRSKQNLATYHKLMNAIFPAQSIYCPTITLQERAYNMAGPSPLFYPKYCYFLSDKAETIGFIVAYPQADKLILKTIGLLPEYRGKKLSDLLVRRVHDQAKHDGLKTVVYSTIRVGNAVHKMKRPGVKIYRRYITLHKSL